VPLSLRPVDPDADAALLHRWVAADRAAFWGMQDASVEDVAAIYGYIDEQPHLTAWLVESDGEPLGLVQTYDPFFDEIGEFYDRQPGDLGVHFFLSGDPGRAGRTTEIVAFVLGQLFDGPVERLVFEPDVRNEKPLALLRRVGAEEGPVVHVVTEHMEKDAQFFFLTRERWGG
jgi:penicillin amidase